MLAGRNVLKDPGIIVGPIEDEDSQAIALNIFRSFSETETEADTEADTEAES